jgi:FKBP-type peptidyl-prolyl cis-trans isomerase
MKLLSTTYLLFIVCSVSFAQKSKQKFTTTPEGLKYSLSVKVKKGKPVQKGDMVRVVYRSFVNDTVEIAKSDNRETPYEFVAGNGDVLKGLDAAVQLLKVGEKATVIIPPALAYGSKKFGKVPENATIRMELEVLGTYPAFYSVDYNQLKRTASGLEYVFVKQNTSGETLKKGNYVAIRYTGYYFTKDGKKKIFDSSMKNGSASLVQYGVNKFIKGLDEGLSLMKAGDSATFIIPPSLGYGAKENQLVPGNSTLGFDVYVERQINPFLDESKISYTKDPSGFSYCIVHDAAGPTAKMNENVYVNVLGYYLLQDGTKFVFESSAQDGQMQHFRLNRAVENPAWLKVLQMCSVGDQVIMAIPPENARMELKKLIPENVTVFFEFKLEAIEEASFIKGEILNELNTASGVNVQSYKIGNGPLIDTTVMTFVHYTGYTKDSTGYIHVFDSSFDRGKPFGFEPGKGQVIRGWEEALLTMREGDEVKIKVPSKVGYGDTGMPPLIMPGEDLYFDLYVVKVLNKDELNRIQNEKNN